jgi:uncharacterized membrane protein
LIINAFVAYLLPFLGPFLVGIFYPLGTWRIGVVYYFVFCFFLAAQSYTGPYKSNFSFIDLGALVMTGMIFFPAFFMGGIFGSQLGRVIKKIVLKAATE